MLRTTRSLFTAVLLIVSFQVLAQTPVVLNTMPLTNVAGSECVSTGVRVESVEQDPQSERQRLVISIPQSLLRNTTNITVHQPDGTALAFSEFRETRSIAEGRNQFGVVLAGNDRIEFKLRFSSEAEPGANNN